MAQTSDAQTAQLASPIQLAQTTWERKPVLAQAQPLQQLKGDGRDRNFQTGIEQFHKGQLRQALATLEQVQANVVGAGVGISRVSHRYLAINPPLLCINEANGLDITIKNHLKEAQGLLER